MGRMGVGPDLGDEQIGGTGFGWQCSRCNYSNPGGSVSCFDCGSDRYTLVRRYVPQPEPAPRRTRAKCTCSECPIHGKKDKTQPRTKPLTKKQQASWDGLMKQLNKSLGQPFATINDKPKKRKPSRKKK